MKKSSFSLQWIALIAIIAFTTVSCSKKLNPLSSEQFTVNPSPLELVGSEVPATVNGRFPAKWFNKNAIVTITPVLKYAGGETTGTPQTFQGEKVKGNNITVSQKEGSTFTLRSSFPYTPQMHKSELYLRFNVSIKGKSIALPDLKVADGVYSTAALATAEASTPALAPDAFQRVIKEKHDASIKFLIQQANLRKSELNAANLQQWLQLVEEANADAKRNVEVEISAYASPDGGYELNEKLAAKREQNTNEYLRKDFQKRDVQVPLSARYTAQDWEGFQELVAASNIQDKDLVLRVLSMYSDPAEREREIKNISIVFKELAETILPELRRSRLTANIDVIGKTDQEMALAWHNNKSVLSLEELLYFASVDNSKAKAVYTYATEKYPNDARAWNNLANVAFAEGDYTTASKLYSKAVALAPQDAAVNSNLALLALKEGDLNKAEQYLGKASQANTFGETLGLLYLKKGDYAKAVSAFGDAKTNNAAVAQLLAKDYNKALQTLNAVPNKDARTAYIAAVISARTNNASGVVTSLRAALAADSSLKEFAKNDLEFAKFLSNSQVASLLK